MFCIAACYCAHVWPKEEGTLATSLYCFTFVILSYAAILPFFEILSYPGVLVDLEALSHLAILSFPRRYHLE